MLMNVWAWLNGKKAHIAGALASKLCEPKAVLLAPEIVDAALRTMDPTEAVKSWFALEQQIGSDWGAALTLTRFLLGDDHAAADAASLLGSAVRATMISALIHQRPEIDVEGLWLQIVDATGRLEQVETVRLVRSRARLGVIAAIDYGGARIGVALSDVARTMALPHATYERRSRAADAEWFRRLASEYQVSLFVVGLPVHLDGRESQESRAARQFGQWLAAETETPCVLFDERFTTAEAEETLRGQRLTAKQRKARRDMLAAQILLGDFLASGCRGQETPGALDD